MRVQHLRTGQTFGAHNLLASVIPLLSPVQHFGPSVDDQAVSLSDDGTTIIIDFWSECR